MSSEANDDNKEAKSNYTQEDEHLYGIYHIIPVDAHELYDQPIEILDFTPPTIQSLKRYNIMTIGDVLDMLDRPASAMITPRSFPEGILNEIIEKMKGHSYLS